MTGGGNARGQIRRSGSTESVDCTGNVQNIPESKFRHYWIKFGFNMVSAKKTLTNSDRHVDHGVQ